MWATIYHDDSGQIHSVAASPFGDETPAEIMTPTIPGLRSARVELPAEIALDPDRLSEFYAELNALVADFVLDDGALRRKP
ncbi:hypothetical protein [Actinomycetospora aeridis]|uniref:Uncharacterized protein n=1 Tax=Actinomycetospora aeridis TaxID=3129231 RepID=A0ABU8N0F6_9PSEU